VSEVVARRHRQAAPVEPVDLQRRDAGGVERLGVERAAAVEARRAIDDQDGGQALARRRRHAQLARHDGAGLDGVGDGEGDLLDRRRAVRVRDRRTERDGASDAHRDSSQGHECALVWLVATGRRSCS
jgi:hypothetical protein